MKDDGPAPVEAQVLFADCRAPGPVSASIGWKVKDVVEAPGSAPVGRGLLQAVDAIGQAYTPDIELARTDRSAEAAPVFKQVRLDGEVMLLAQFADAGIDRTGRASYTMHGLLHSAPLQSATGEFRRPVELLGSSMWLRPVGNDAVEAATVKGARFDLPPGPIGLGDVVGDAFLTDLDRPERVAVLPVVLEAFRVALDDDATAVLVVSTPMESARWFALLSNLVDPVSAARMRFSTREELLSAATVDAWDYHLVAVVPSPSTAVRGRDVMASLGSRFVVVDTARPPEENADGSWITTDGGTLHRSAWTELAETVLMSPVVTGGVRQRLDHLAAGVTGLAAAPTWGLPVAALLAGADLPDRDHAVRWVFEHWPAHAAVDPGLVDELGTVLARAIGESESLSTELSDGVGEGVPAFLADAVIAGAVRRALRDLRHGTAPPGLSRPLSVDAAVALEPELPDLLAWVGQVAPADRVPVVEHVVRFGTGAGLRHDAVLAALRPAVDAVVRAVVDPRFDPRVEGWPPIPPDLWDLVFAVEVGDALTVRDPDVEVSPATHEWLTPSLGATDLPEKAARHRDLVMSSYGHRRAAWRGGSADPWLSATFAVGMMHVNTFRYSMPPEVAVQRAMERAFAGLPIPVEVAERILAVLDEAGHAARLTVGVQALIDGRFTPEQRRLAQSLRDALQDREPLGPEFAPVFLTLYQPRLVRGDPAATLDPLTRPAAEGIARRLDELVPPALREAARRLVLAWGVRLPVYAVRGADYAPVGFESVATALDAAAPDFPSLDEALATVLGTDADVTPTVAHLVVRAGLALEERDVNVDPYVRWLRRVDDRGDPLLLREGLAGWYSRQDKGASDRVAAAIDAVIDDLMRRGWRHRLTDLEADRDNLVAALQSRSLLGRRRTRR